MSRGLTYALHLKENKTASYNYFSLRMKTFMLKLSTVNEYSFCLNTNV